MKPRDNCLEYNANENWKIMNRMRAGSGDMFTKVRTQEYKQGFLYNFVQRHLNFTCDEFLI